HPYALALELWDGASKNYATRCTYEDVTTRPGRQTLLYHIARACRNGKEGLDWGELEAKDKIDRDGLTQVKLFLTPLADRDAVMWIDNIRLMQEDAAKPKLNVPLPAGARAFKFGGAGAKAPGFTTVTPDTVFPGAANCGFVDPNKLAAGGAGWPDGLSGTFVLPHDNDRTVFRARVPAGDYFVWLCGGPIIYKEWEERHYLLRAGGETLYDDLPAPFQYYSRKYLYRFLDTRYSEKPHALWTNFIDRMYPVYTTRVTIADGTFTVTAANSFLSAVVLVPASGKQDFEKFADTVRKLRIEAFEKTLRPLPGKKPQQQPGDGPFLLYEPDFAAEIKPWTGPTAEERKHTSLKTAAAQGQLVALRLAVTPFADLGQCTLETAPLKEPAEIGADRIAVYSQNYRYDGDNLSEMALIPSPSLEVEQGVTQCFWLTLDVPQKTEAGVYKGELIFRPGKGDAVHVPLELEVYPFALEPVLPVSFGMYYAPRHEPGLAPDVQRRLVKEQLQWMRGIGFTAVQVGPATVTGLGKGGAVQMEFDTTLYDLAREVGMGRHPKQYLMGEALGVGRGVGHRLIGEEGGLKIDRNPGLELRQPGFGTYFVNAMRQERDFIRRIGMPVALEVADEPRENPNPWNRNLADSIAYGDLMRQAGVVSFITPMGDMQDGKDYTVLADHVDIISTHAWKGSAGLIARTRDKGKTLWLYNTGMDRFSWGFYNWRARSEGRWEWHFCWFDDSAKGGYPGREWYNPFTNVHGFAPYAPADYPAGMLFQSKFLDVAEGINDYAYLTTLDEAMRAAAGDPKKADAVKEAKAFLAALDRAIPELPGAKGLLNAGDGALVGMGVDDEARLQAPHWRESIARLLKALKQ
ncbi:MAG TPA: glycoside hydrolase domain-containing protein, partial [Gemmataceae bacterium]|nr:glycoside hydrolase domain-containing protein [Gemmataceae bacterium]